MGGGGKRHTKFPAECIVLKTKRATEEFKDGQTNDVEMDVKICTGKRTSSMYYKGQEIQ